MRIRKDRQFKALPNEHCGCNTFMSKVRDDSPDAGVHQRLLLRKANAEDEGMSPWGRVGSGGEQ